MSTTPPSFSVSERTDPIARELEQYAIELGAELYGVASADEYAREFPGKPQPSAFVEGARSVIVIGLPFEPGTLSTVLSPEQSGLRVKASDEFTAGGVQPQGAEQFFPGEEHGMLNRELSWMEYRIAKFLRRRGWKALYLPVTKQDTRFRTAPFSHMPAMYLAGLGTLGLNCSILTPELALG